MSRTRQTQARRHADLTKARKARRKARRTETESALLWVAAAFFALSGVVVFSYFASDGFRINLLFGA